MNKRELIKALEGVDDDTVIIVLNVDDESWSNIGHVIPETATNSQAAITIGGYANEIFSSE